MPAERRVISLLRFNQIYHFSDNKTYKCGGCRQRLSIKVGSIVEGSNAPLRKWLILDVAAHAKTAIASTQLAKDLGVT